MNTKSFTILRELAIYFVAGLITLLTSSTASAAPPSTPTDLRVDVYSSTASEIFWSRSTDTDGFVSGYEVRQDGELVATFDGLSFFIDELSEGVSTEFSVTAIDSDNERSGAASITVTSGNSNDVLNNTDDRPTPPANLNAIVYSTSAAEVFWDRNPDQPLSYEISLDGVVVTTTSGTSYFNGNLEASRSFAIDVVAVDLNGQRSDAANAVINTSGDTNANQPTGQPPSLPNSSITSPTNLRLEVYSGTAGELFWDRSAQAEDVETTEIRRDDVALATTQGTSFFDSTRTAGVAYRYEVVFLGFNGAQSDPAVFDESGSSATPPPLTNAPPAPANARIEVYSGTAAELFWDRAASSANITETQVLRDGSLIGSTQGNSFFDGSRVSGVEYRYELQNINSNGVRSEIVVLGETSDVQIPATPTTPNTTRVTFDITVPAYMSNELQVRIESADINTTAAFVRDESWSASEDFLINTDNPLVVTFADRNGAITLGTAETSFRTGTAESETVQITVDQFNTERFDNDNDGISNLDELIAGTFSEASSDAGDLPQSVQASLEILPIKTFRISWQPSANAEFYRVLENQDGISGFTPVSEDLDRFTESFDHRVALFKSLNARYIVEACNSLGCASSNELFVTGTLESGIGAINASNPEERIGQEVTISADGQTLAFIAFRSAPTELENTTPSLSSAYIYTLEAGVWQQQARVEPNNLDIGDAFGTAISLSRDGTVLAVSSGDEGSAASGINGDESDNSLRGSGAVYIFTLADGSWQQEAYIKASEPAEFERFGGEIDLSADGETLAVTATFGVPSAVHIFVRADSGWQQQAEITSDRGRLANFVSLSENGDTLATGGTPHVFSRRDGVWLRTAVLEREEIGALRGFGSSGVLSDDGMTLVISASNDGSRATGINPPDEERFTNATLELAGGVHVFVLANESWVQQAYIKPSVAERFTAFGNEVSISSDGDTLAVSSRENTVGTGIFADYTTLSTSISSSSPDRTGSIYIYRRSVGTWRREAYVKPAEDMFLFIGKPVLDGSGDTMVIQGDDRNNRVAYIY